MIVNIANEVLTAIKNGCPMATVLAEYPSTTPSFPCIIVQELSNDTHLTSVDTSGETHNSISFEINIFSNAQNKITQVRGLRDTIDGIMSGAYGMSRMYSGSVPNYLDANIYRYTLRYDCVVNSNKQIFRR